MREHTAYDIVVVGAGPVGENIADYATAGTDLTGVLIERELVGGECSYYACMPSTALLRAVEVVDTAAHLGGVVGARLDVPAVLRRRDEWVSRYDDSGQFAWAEGVGLSVLRGEARLVGARRVSVATADGEVLLEARRTVVLATGSEPVTLEPYAACEPWGSRDATAVVEIPDRLVIVGGGVVACEAATWLTALGSRVTMLVREDRLLARVEPFAADLVADALRGAGVDLRLHANVESCRRESPRATGFGRIHGGVVTLRVDTEDLEADEILVAAGRRPRLTDLGLDRAGLDQAAVAAGEVPDWLVVVGDASGEAALTHWGKYRARVLGARIAAGATGRDPDPMPANVPVPQVIFTDPQVASVGRTEAEARDAGLDVVVTNVPWSAAAGAGLLRDDATGAAQLVVDARTHRLVGATFVGTGAGELLHAATIAIVGAVPTEVLRHAVPCYPTASELWLRLLELLPEEFRRPAAAPSDATGPHAEA